MTKIMIPVDKITILSGRGPDRITLWTKLPSATPRVDRAPATLELIAAAETGEEYVRTHFPGVITEVIEV